MSYEPEQYSGPPQQGNNLQYVIAVVVMAFLGVAAIVLITLLRPASDNTTLISSVIGFLLPTTMALLAFLKAQETHLAVNSRLDAFMKATNALAHAAGREQGRSEEKKEESNDSTRSDSNARG